MALGVAGMSSLLKSKIPATVPGVHVAPLVCGSYQFPVNRLIVAFS